MDQDLQIFLKYKGTIARQNKYTIIVLDEHVSAEDAEYLLLNGWAVYADPPKQCWYKETLTV